MRRLASSASYWFHFGPQGESRHLTNAAGVVTNSYSYTGYGVATGGGILCGAR